MTKNFYYLWVSQILSQLTINLMNFLLLARLFSQTGSSIATSLLWVSFALPAIFFGPIGAVTVDLFSRRKTLMFTNFMQALVIFLYFWINESSMFLLFFVVLAYSFFNQFYIPAETALLPSLVSKEKLAKANSLFFMTQQSSLILGFGFAGLIQSWISFSGSILLCSILLFLAFVSVSFLPKVDIKSKVVISFENAISTFLNSILEGYRFIKARKIIMYSLVLILSIQIALAIVTINLPAVATDILKLSLNLLGVMLVIPAGIGALIGALYISKKLGKDYRKKTVIEFGLLLLGISTLLICLGYLWLSPLLVLLLGLGFVFVNIPTVTFLQEITPTVLRGRVFGNLGFLITLVTIFPVLLSGFITELIGVRYIFIMMGIVALIGLFLIKKHGQKVLTDNWA